MVTDRQLLQWGRQGNEIHKAPNNLYWYAILNEQNIVIKNYVFDELTKISYENNPSNFSNIKPSNENIIENQYSWNEQTLSWDLVEDTI
jgi:hypothetical protein